VLDGDLDLGRGAVAGEVAGDVAADPGPAGAADEGVEADVALRRLALLRVRRGAPRHQRGELLVAGLDLAAHGRLALLGRQLDPPGPQTLLLEERLALRLFELEELRLVVRRRQRVIKLAVRRGQSIRAHRARQRTEEGEAEEELAAEARQTA